MRLAAALAAAVAASAAVGCRDLNVVTHSFATMDEARRAGAVERGWLPPVVPAGAHDIREAHDENDPDRRWGLFSFTGADDAALRAALGPDVGFGGLAADAPPRIEWWPVILRGAVDAERAAATGLLAYRAEGGRLLVAVNWKQRRAYYWTPPRRAP